MDEFQLKLLGIEKERDDAKRVYEFTKAQFENLKIEIEKERIVNKQKFREEIDVLI